VDLKACPNCGAMAASDARRCMFCDSAFDTVPQIDTVPRFDTSAAWVPPAGYDRPFTSPASGVALPPPMLPVPPSRPRRRAGWLVWAIVALVGVIVVVAITARQLTDKQPLPLEEDAIHGVGEWVTFVDPNRAFSIAFPEPPELGDETTTAQYRSRTISARILRVWYFVEYIDFFEGFTGGVYGETFLDGRAADYAKQFDGTLLWSQRVAVGGLPASEFVIDAPDGVHHVAAVLTGKRLYYLQVVATVDATGGYRRFVDSFEPLTPDQ